MWTLETARQIICDFIEPLAQEQVPLDAALGRVAAETVLAPLDLPLFDNSAMDGYAVRVADVENASPTAPVPLRVAGQITAGQPPSGTVEPGHCLRLFTGSPLPPGADAVVMQEDTRVAPNAPDTILVSSRALRHQNVRYRGEDVSRGKEVLSPGTRVTIGLLGLLGALGIAQLRVRRQPSVGLLASGSELLEPGQPWTPGKIYESNRITLSALLRRAGAVPEIFPPVPDNLAEICSRLEAALARCDAVVTTGGVSVGEWDLVKTAFERLGGRLEFWKVAIKPGRPFVFGRRGDKFLFGLPGNPVSAVVTFLLLVRPALLRWQAAADLELPCQGGVLAEPLLNAGERRHFMRVRMDQAGNVFSAGIQAAHVLSSLAHAQGLVDVPPETSWPAGTAVVVQRWDL